MKTLPKRFSWVTEEFNRIATFSVLGDPNGTLAYTYCRVSSSGQAEEGRSGLPRQLMHVHEKAQALGLAIPWELVFFDDHTGFEFRGRPGLTELRELVRVHPRSANDLIIENIDRLSREATWQQGYLLDEFENENKVKIHFWKELGSKLERAVYGTVAQDRMLTDLERMAKGNIHKANSGRVTARTPAYGYRFVNAQGGNTNTTKETYYAPVEPEAGTVQMIFRWLVEERLTLGEVSRRLMQRKIKTPKGGQVWDFANLRAITRNTVYKGEFYAHRYVHVEKISRLTGKPVTHKVERPRDEWILVPVPALVSAEVWAEAQQVIRANRTLSLRNAKREYLLLSLLYCADCRRIKMSVGGKYNYRETSQGQKRYEASYYRCTNRTRLKHITEALGCRCTMPQITSKKLDTLVWNAVVQILLDRNRMEEGLDRYFAGQQVETTREEIVFIQSQLGELDHEDELLYAAYKAHAFDAGEFAQKRHALKEAKQRLQESKEELQQRLSRQTSRQEMKEQILASVEVLQQQAAKDIPFALKRKILMQVVDKITANTREEWFTIEGAIAGTFDFTLASTDFEPPRA